MQYELKSKTLGPGRGQHREIVILNRKLRWTSSSLELEADDRHAEIIIEQLGLCNAKSCTTPAARINEEIRVWGAGRVFGRHWWWRHLTAQDREELVQILAAEPGAAWAPGGR